MKRKRIDVDVIIRLAESTKRKRKKKRMDKQIHYLRFWLKKKRKEISTLRDQAAHWVDIVIGVRCDGLE
jgi:hypothetical protein